MEAVPRYMHVRFAGGSNLDAALDTPQQFQALVAECAARSAMRSTQHRARSLALEALKEATALYERRNRFVHNALRHNLANVQHLERSKLWRPKREAGEPLLEPKPVSAEEIVKLVFDLVRTT